MPVFGRYQAVIAGFPYAASAQARTGAAGKVWPFRKYDTATDGTGLKLHWATCQDCQRCPFKSACVPGAKRKQLTRTLYAPYRRARQSAAGPAFGHLIHRCGLRRMNVRGHAGAHKPLLLTAVAYNLKKLLKYRPERQLSLAVALPKPQLAANRRHWWRNRRLKAPDCLIAT